MLVTIDESGCSGFKPASSKYLVMSMVIFDSFKEAERCGLAIKTLQRGLGISPEFHFTRDSCFIRDAFFEEVKRHDFKVRNLYVEKSRIHSHFLRTRPKKFYNFCIKQLIDHDDGRLQNATVKIDKCAKRERTEAFISYLRSEAPHGKFKNIKAVDSTRDTLVQLADYVVGAVARPYNSDQRNNPTRWLNMIVNKIEDDWFFR